MAPGALPLLLLGGAAVVLAKKPKRKRASCADSSNEIHEEKKSQGLICDFKSGDWVEESELDGAPLGEEVGDFEVIEEDILPSKDEDIQVEEEIEEAESSPEKDPQKICEEFLSAVHVRVTEIDELPINEIAVNESVFPAMKLVLNNLAQMHGKPLDPEMAGPKMVRQALAALVPACEWLYDDMNDEFIYNNKYRIESEKGKEVLYGLMELSRRLLDEYNRPVPEATQPRPGLGLVG